MTAQELKLAITENLRKVASIIGQFFKSHQIVSLVIPTLLISSGTFVLLRNYEQRRSTVFAATSTYKVELPKGIDKKDLGNLTTEQKKKLDKQVTDTLAKIKKGKTAETSQQVVVVVLTQNGQPILPDLEKKEEESESRGGTGSLPSPTPTSITVATPTAFSGESGEAQATPTPRPCNDTDPTQNIYIKGECQDKDKKIADVCEGDSITLDQYGCDWSTLLCTLRKSNCTYNCFDGRCLKPDESELGLLSPTPTPSCSPTPTAVLSPTVTPAPTNVPCVDTDGGKDIYTKGTVTTWGKAYNDTCYSVQTGKTLTECSDYYCRLLEYSCQPQGYQGEPFTCQYGCKDGACFKVNEIRFSYSSEAEQKYKEKYQSELKNEVEKIYQEAKKIFGQPFKDIDVSIAVCNSEYYDASTNRICFDDQNVPLQKTLISLILSAFHDELAYFLPENWEKGMNRVTMIEINRNLFDQNFIGLEDQVSTYEIFNLTKAYASKYGNLYSGELFNEISYLSLASGALFKPFLEDNQFLANLNKAIYSEPVIDNTIKDKILNLAASVKGTVEGESSAAWLARQYILQVNSQPGNYLMFYVGRDTPYQPVYLKVKAMQVFADGIKKGINGLAIEAGASDYGHVRVWTTTKNTTNLNGQDGRVDFETPKGSGDAPGFPADYTGSLHFGVPVTNYNSPGFCYPYRNGEAVKIDGQQGLFGCFQDRTTGELKAKAGGSTYSKTLENGNFSFPELKNYRGQIELSYTDTYSNREVKKILTKMMPDYYTSLFVGSASSSSRGAPIGPGTNCTDGGQDYENEDFKLKFKIPLGWADNSVDEHQSETFIYRHLISTDTPEKQLDPKYKISYFDILASTEDLKDSDYGMWLENNTGNQQKTSVDFKGVSAEKYTDDTQMPCASQTEEGAACNYHSEIYYFEKDDIYYLLSLGIYTSADVKEQNETNLKCFLENFAFSGQEEVVGGMKLFTSERLKFKIRYPSELFAYEWQSDYQPNFNEEKPDSDRNIVQFFKNKDLTGEKITIRRETNTQRKTAKDYAKAYWSASEESLSHWKPGNIDFVVYSVNIEGGREKEKTYLTPLGDWMYLFNSSETGGLQLALEKMLPTLEFTGTGTESFQDLIPCPGNLLSTSEELSKQQENWWGKPDLCDSRSEQKICGYVRSIFDNGIIQIGNNDYRNPYCYCSFFEKNGSRTYRGTQMFSLGYKEGACKEKI